VIGVTSDETARIIAACEALEVGDVELAHSILRDLERDTASVTRCCWRCECGQGFKWPGLLDAHRFHCAWTQAA
jgi:hypothetical protein